MPVCKKCKYMGPSSELRQSPTWGHLCKDNIACKRRQKELAK